MENLIIFWKFIFADMAIYYFKKFTNYKINYVVCDKQFIKKKYFNNIKVIPSEKLTKLDKKKYKLFIAVIYSKMNKVRENIFIKYKKLNFKFVNFIHPDARAYPKKIGVNNFIMENVSINPHTKIGNNNIFWSSNIIGHHSIVGNNNFFSGNSTISGSNLIKNNNFFGVNSCTKDSIQIKNYCFIDANEYVSKNLPNEVYFNKNLNPKNRLKTSNIFL